MGSKFQNLGDEVKQRVGEGIALAVIALAAREASSSIVLTGVTDFATTEALLFGLSNLGLIIAIGGFVLVLWRAGPIGILGYLLEFAGTANLESGGPNIRLLLLGAIIVVAATSFWSWDLFLENSGSNRR